MVLDADVPKLEAAIARLWDLAVAGGLRPRPTAFEVVPSTVMYEVAAYGLPGRFSHWSHGKAYQMMKNQYDLGLARYFELVINSDPAQAFLLENNDLLTNTLVVAHVLGHTDFFAHNAHFAPAPTKMPELVSVHAQRLRAYQSIHGRDKVEAFLDALLTIEEHVDPRAEEGGEGRDLLLFLTRYAVHLADWQRDVAEMLRQEALYFRPQLRTKVMNEGWATLWHARLLRQLDLGDRDYVNFARLNAMVRSPDPGRLNPYLLGVSIFEDILEGFGEEEGLRRCMDIRAWEDDVAFIRNHFTPGVAERIDAFVYGFRPDLAGGGSWTVMTKDFEAVRDALVTQLENGGRPVIEVVDRDWERSGALYLRHGHDGRDLDLGDAQHVLRRIALVWGRRVHLETVSDRKRHVLTADPDGAAC